MRKRIMYLSHVNWNWIKQRPHFLYEGLTDAYDMTYVCGNNFKKKDLAKNIFDEKSNKKSFFRIPNKIKSLSNLLYLLDVAIGRLQITWIAFSLKPDLIWVTSPEVSQYLPKSCTVPIVFDFMDDYPLLVNSKIISSHLHKELNNILFRSRTVFASSNNLYEKAEREKSGNVVLVNNAAPDYLYEIESKIDKNSIRSSSNKLKLVYLGAISSWFDIDLVIELVKKYSTNVEVDLYGPIEIDIPTIDSLNYKGILEHGKIQSVMKEYDVFLMPFKVSPLIEAVDPVKIYEYLLFGKFVVTPDYSELNKFGDLIFKYKSYDDFFAIINLILSGNCRHPGWTKILEFSSNNKWSDRQLIVKNELKKILH